MADEAIPEPVRAAWAHLADAWSEPARHDAFVALVAQHNCYAWAAARYKERADDPIAARQLERLRRATTAALLATATTRKAPAEGTPYKSTMTVLVALVVAAICGLVYAMLLHQTRR